MEKILYKYFQNTNCCLHWHNLFCFLSWRYELNQLNAIPLIPTYPNPSIKILSLTELNVFGRKINQSEWKEKIEFDYEIVNQDNDLICTGNTSLAFIDMKKNISTTKLNICDLVIQDYHDHVHKHVSSMNNFENTIMLSCG